MKPVMESFDFIVRPNKLKLLQAVESQMEWDASKLQQVQFFSQYSQ